MTRLDLAFSRDSNKKVYVRDRLREHEAELWAWLEAGAFFYYVCGGASPMAKDVEAAPRNIICHHGGKSPEQAQEYLTAMKWDRRRWQSQAPLPSQISSFSRELRLLRKA